MMEAKDDYDDDMVSEVLDILNRTLSLDVECGQAWYLWGKMKVLFRDWEDAERYLRAGTEHGAVNPEAWALHSVALSELGREEEAEEVFQEFKRRESKMLGYGL